MSDQGGGGFSYPDVDQAIRFHYELMQRLGKEVTEAPNEARVKSSLDRAIQMAQTQRGDMVSLTAFLMYGLIRDKPFGPGSAQTGMALTMARDLGSLGIRVVAVAPSLFSTGITQGIPDEFADVLTKDAAFPKRMGRPEEYGKLVAAIVENPMLNGSCIRLDAGQRFAPK